MIKKLLKDSNQNNFVFKFKWNSINTMLVVTLVLFTLSSCALFRTSTREETNPSESSAPAATTSGSEANKPWGNPLLGIDDIPAEGLQGKSKPQDGQYKKLREAVLAGQDEQIINVAAQILTLAPEDPAALNAMAMVYFRKSRYDAGLFLLKKAIAKNQNAGFLYSNQGIIYLAKAEDAKALASFRKALSLNPQDGVAAANLCAIFVREKDYDKAYSTCEVAFNSSSSGTRSVAVSNNYGVSLMAMGDFQKAREIFKSAITDSSPNKILLHNYAILLIDHLQDYSQGLEIISKIKFIGSNSESINRINELENKAKAGIK